MNIYIDFDDCLCETALYFTKIAKELFGKDIPYKDIKYFDLQKSFSLSDEEYNLMMEEAQTAPTPCTSCALFCNGEWLTNEQQNNKRFLKLIKD